MKPLFNFKKKPRNSEKKEIYLDNSATTRVDDSVLEAMLPYFKQDYGNASSSHAFGKKAKRALEQSRETISKAINAEKSEIYFTSGGTESNNLALKGLFFSNYPRKNHFITTKIEHASVINVCKWLRTQGAKITYLDVDGEGFIDLKQLEKSINRKTIAVSIIHANNEIGTIQDLMAIGEICKKKGVLFHTDACQSFTKAFIDVKQQYIDLMTLNAHKIYGPKGIGALYIRKGVEKIIVPVQHGGGHERGLRSGTENVAGAVGFARAVEISNPLDVQRMSELRDKLIKGVLENPGIKLNGPKDSKKRLCNNANFIFQEIDGEAVGEYLQTEGIYTSTGSACLSHSQEPNHVLIALGCSLEDIGNAIRITLSKYTTEKEIDFVLETLPKVIKRIKEIESAFKTKKCVNKTD